MHAFPADQRFAMTAAPIPTDDFADLANTDAQRLAARMVQDSFTTLFRQLAAPEAEGEAAAAELEERCANWCQAGGDEEGRALRLALLVAGLDQWGLAYAQAFALSAIPPLSSLLGKLRTRLDPQAEARFQRYFSQLDQSEGAAIDFKVELRRAIHLGLWHALAACEQADSAQALMQALGSLMLALDQKMPSLGWRLNADTLAHIQIALLTETTSPLAQETTQQLFTALRQTLPRDRHDLMLATSGQAVLAWQKARRAQSH